MDAPAFVDANVLSALFIEDEPKRLQVKLCLQRLLDERHPLWVSRQVLRELAATLIKYKRRDGSPKMIEICNAVGYVEQQFRVAEDSAAVTARLLHLLKEHPECRPEHVHDLNILATMQVHGITKLVTFDKDFQQLVGDFELLLLSAK